MEDLLKEIKEKVDAIRERIIKFRREIHRNPELSGQEKNTSAFVAGVLEDNDIEVIRNVGGHGVVGIVRGAHAGDTIALRADMDALPIQDQKDADYASNVRGVMHACGHDVHTAVLMGAAIVLSSLKDRLRGNVKFIFQPSEEKGPGGAKDMIEAGVLEDPTPSAIVALHCYPEFNVGTIGHKPGMMTAAADKLRIVIKGRSGHASRPHQSVDAVLVAAMVVTAVNHIVSRRTNPLHPTVISIGTIKGGNAPNIIADTVTMEGTVRTLNNEAREKIPVLIEEIIKGITSGMGADYEFSYQYGSPPVYNDPVLDELVASCAADILGPDGVIEMADPMMGAEDFAYYAERIPGVLFRIGTGNPDKGITASLHQPRFDVDEESIVIGTKLMSWIVVRYLGSGGHGGGKEGGGARG